MRVKTPPGNVVQTVAWRVRSVTWAGGALGGWGRAHEARERVGRHTWGTLSARLS